MVKRKLVVSRFTKKLSEMNISRFCTNESNNPARTDPERTDAFRSAFDDASRSSENQKNELKNAEHVVRKPEKSN